MIAVFRDRAQCVKMAADICASECELSLDTQSTGSQEEPVWPAWSALLVLMSVTSKWNLAALGFVPDCTIQKECQDLPLDCQRQFLLYIQGFCSWHLLSCQFSSGNRTKNCLFVYFFSYATLDWPSCNQSLCLINKHSAPSPPLEYINHFVLCIH